MPHETAQQNLAHPASAAPEGLMQRTLRGPAECSGIGVHSGEKVSLRLLPAPENSGIVFVRTDLRNGARKIPARWDHVIDTQLCTIIGNDHGSRIATVEHLMAALSAYGVDNAVIEINGAEVPVMDGSSDSFVFLIEMAGVVTQKAPRRYFEILKPVETVAWGKRVALTPAAETRFSFEIEFGQKPISSQAYDFTLSAPAFKSEIARARTFGFFEEVDQMRKMGFARGGSLHNAVVIKDDQVMNEDGLRYTDEFVRHKVLDAIGDLALAGAPILGHFHGRCSGHALNNQLLRTLFADKAHWRLTEAA